MRNQCSSSSCHAARCVPNVQPQHSLDIQLYVPPSLVVLLCSLCFHTPRARALLMDETEMNIEYCECQYFIQAVQS